MNTMDNQQETTKAYIAAILDGEGCIHLSIQTRRGPLSKGVLHHIIQIANTSKDLVSYLSKWFDEQAIPYHVHWTTPKGKNQKIYAQIRVTRFHGIKKFLTLIRPYLIIKSKQADLMLEFVERRLKLLADGGSKLWLSYTNRDYEIMNLLKQLNMRGIGPSTTIRETADADDIVSSRNESYELR